MKILTTIAAVLLWLALDHAVTLTSAHSPAPTPAQWAELRQAHRSNLADR